MKTITTLIKNPTNKSISLLFIALGLVAVTVTVTSCSASDDKQAEKSQDIDKPTAPKVTDNSKQLLFSWFEENEAKTATDVKEIPDNVKKEVRVQDLSVPPEKRDPHWMFLANLTQKDNMGRYIVIAVKRDDYEQKRHPAEKTSPEKSPAAVAASVVMYATPHCPHCKTARKWLLEQKIPYKEIDVSKNQTAAAVLAQKGQAQGVSTSGVPIFEINGRLVPGFSPEAINKALTLPPVQPQPSVIQGAPTPPLSPRRPAPKPPSSLTI